MKSNKRMFAFAVVGLILVSVLAAPVTAETTWTPFDATSTFVPPPVWGREWVSEDGVLHARGMEVINSFVSTDPRISGTLLNRFNANWHLLEPPQFAYGRMWGTIRIDNAGGYWEGSYVAERTYPEEFTYGHVVLQGYGDYEGLEARYDLANETPDPFGVGVAHGVIMDPGGE